MSVKQVNHSSGEGESCTEYDDFWHETNLASSSCYEVCDVQRDFILKVTKRAKGSPTCMKPAVYPKEGYGIITYQNFSMSIGISYF